MAKRFVGLVIASMALAAPAFAQQQQATPQERQAMETQQEKYLQAFNKHDIKGVAALYDDNAIFVGPQPNIVEGKPALEQQLQQDMKTFSNLKTQIMEIRPLGNNMVLAIGTWESQLNPANIAMSRQQRTTEGAGTSQQPAEQAQGVHGNWTAVQKMQGSDAKIVLLTTNIIPEQSGQQGGATR